MGKRESHATLLALQQDALGFTDRGKCSLCVVLLSGGNESTSIVVRKLKEPPQGGSGTDFGHQLDGVCGADARRLA